MSEGGGVVARRDEAAQQRAYYDAQRREVLQQQRQQQQTYQQAVQQRAVQQNAYQNAVGKSLQKQVYQKALQRQQVQKQFGQAMQTNIAKQRAYHQAAQQRIAEQQEYLRRTQSQVLEKQKEMNEDVKEWEEKYLAREQEFEMGHSDRAEQSSVDDVVTIEQIWEELEISSEVWPLMLDDQPKAMTVSRYVDWYAQQGINIRKPPLYYVRIIDSMSQQNPEMLNSPFKDLLKIVAILDYDFDNGQDNDAMALRILGEEGYWKNKERLGL